MALLNIPKGVQYSQNHRDRSYTQVVKRKGQKFTTEELNYEGQIGQFHTEALYQDILGPMFIGDAFKVVAPAQLPENNNSLVITEGKLYTRLGELILPEDKTYEQVKSDIKVLPINYGDYVLKATFNDSGPDIPEFMITTPPVGTRSDLLVLVITKVLIGSDLDPQIKDNVLGEDSAGRYKLFYSFRIMKGMGITSEWQNSFTYEDEFIFRIPLAVINRTAGFDLITNDNIVDLRSTYGEVMTTPLYKKVLNHITAIQGSGKGFNADMVDGRNVNDDIPPSVHTLWTSKYTRDYVELRAKGIIPENPIESYRLASSLPLAPTPGFRYIVEASDDLNRPNFKVDHIYTYITGGGGDVYGYSETAPKQGMLLINKDTSAFMMYSETALEEPGVYGNHWFDFGGISNHASLSSVLKVEEDLDDSILKHVTDLQYKTIKDDILTNASQINAQGNSFTGHTSAPVIDHPDKSVTFDKVVNHTINDSVTLSTSTANVGELLNRIGTAIKTLAGGADWQTSISKKLNESGGTLTGNLTLNSSSKLISQNTTDASSTDGAIRTAGGISADKQGYFGGLLTASAGLNVTGDITVGTQTNKATISYTTDSARTYTIPNVSTSSFVMTEGNQTIGGNKTFSGVTTISNVVIGGDRFLAGGTMTNEGEGGVGSCISILGTVALDTPTSNPSVISIGRNAEASGLYSTALGLEATASGLSSTAIGHTATASGFRSTALGLEATASGLSSTALGRKASASGDYSTALGYNTTASGDFSTALGHEATASGTSPSTALGHKATASGEYSTALGFNSTASNYSSIALGVFAEASGENSTALGYNATASKYSSTALGYNAEASGENSTALGRNATASVNNRMTLGNSNTNVYLGSGSAVTSDQRDKTEIEDNDLGLDFLKKVRTAKYRINHRDRYYKRDEDGRLILTDNGQPIVDEEEHTKATKKGKRIHRGVIAQELEKLIDTTEFSAVKHSTVNNANQYDDYAVDYIQFIPVMIKAIQELSDKVEEQEKIIQELRK